MFWNRLGLRFTPDVKETGCTIELIWGQFQPPNAEVHDLTLASGITNVKHRMLYIGRN